MFSFASGNIILAPVNQRLCKNCIHVKQNSHSNHKQENDGAAYYRKIFFARDWFQGASSQN